MKKLSCIIGMIVSMLTGCHDQGMTRNATGNDTPNASQDKSPTATPGPNPAPNVAEKAEAHSDPRLLDIGEPVFTGRVSQNMEDAQGKKLTRCEYRYLSREGDFVSVVAEINGSVDIWAVEKKPEDKEPRLYKKGSGAADANYLTKMLHAIDTYGTLSGPMKWVDAPEREQWKDDDSTTWILMTFEDVQFVVSSRQQLPEHRYKGFHSVYTYLSSFIPKFDRKMHQNIGEPSPDLIKIVHGKEVRLVPGTGNTVLTGAEIDYGSKKWWIEEEFTGVFETTPESLNRIDGEFYSEKVNTASISFDDNGNFLLKINEHEFLGSLERTRRYGVMANAYYFEKNDQIQERIQKDGYLESGRRFMIDYEMDGEVEKESDLYRRIRLFFPGEPYVPGRGAIEPVNLFLDRKS